jgi:mRNA interferase MazF
MTKTLRDQTTVRTGDIVLVALDPTLGSETRKTRPCLLIEAGGSPLNLVIALPVTDNTPPRPSPLFVTIDDLPLAGPTKPSAIDCYQLRTVSLERVVRRLGSVGPTTLDTVRQRLAVLLDIGEEHLLR